MLSQNLFKGAKLQLDPSLMRLQEELEHGRKIGYPSPPPGQIQLLPSPRRAPKAHHNALARRAQLNADPKRVDKAIQQIELAKKQAEQQKQEYAQFLEWKVQQQRKAQRMREREEAEHAEKLARHLQEVLHERHVQKREAARSFYEPALKTSFDRSMNVTIGAQSASLHDTEVRATL